MLVGENGFAGEDGVVVANAMYSMAFDMITNARWSDASDVFRAMVLFCPRDERGWLGLGRCHQELGQVDVAIELYLLGIRAVPRAVRLRLALADAFRETERDDDARYVLDAAEELASALDDDELSAWVSNRQEVQRGY